MTEPLTNATATLPRSIKPAADLRVSLGAGALACAILSATGASSAEVMPSLFIHQGKAMPARAELRAPEYFAVLRSPELVSGNSSIREEWSLRSLREEYDFAREEDWDGAGGKPISGEVLTNMAYLLGSLPPLPPPSEVAPLTDGALSITWEEPAGYLFIAVGPKNVLHVYFDIQSLGKWERITSVGNALARRQLIAAIRAIGRPQTMARADETDLVAELIAA